MKTRTKFSVLLSILLQREHSRWLAVSVTLLLGLTLTAGLALAQSPGQRDFDVVSVSALGQLGQNAFGVSNGVGWAICDNHFAGCCGANINGTYNGFNTGNFAPPVSGEDNLHITQTDFTLVFEQPVASVVFYLRENGGSASLDFGLPPTVISGAGNLNIVGTRIFPNTSGGAVRFDNINSQLLNHTTAIFDGTNLAFYVEALDPNAGPPSGSGAGLCDKCVAINPSIALTDPDLTNVTTSSFACSFDVTNETDDPDDPADAVVLVTDIEVTVAVKIGDGDFFDVLATTLPPLGAIAAGDTATVDCGLAFPDQPDATAVRVTVTVTACEVTQSVITGVDIADPD